jgi:hypothetical protein
MNHTTGNAQRHTVLNYYEHQKVPTCQKHHYKVNVKRGKGINCTAFTALHEHFVYLGILTAPSYYHYFCFIMVTAVTEFW